MNCDFKYIGLHFLAHTFECLNCGKVVTNPQVAPRPVATCGSSISAEEKAFQEKVRERLKGLKRYDQFDEDFSEETHGEWVSFAELEKKLGFEL